MRDLTQLFAALDKSRFRSRFGLSLAEETYLADKSLLVVLDHARDFVVRRLAPARVANDGRQTPMRGHPVFVAQHATATCCRKCLAKWHDIPTGRRLTDDEIDYIVRVIGRWLAEQTVTSAEQFPRQLRLFPP